jgi:hypothetical protein
MEIKTKSWMTEKEINETLNILADVASITSEW